MTSHSTCTHTASWIAAAIALSACAEPLPREDTSEPLDVHICTIEELPVDGSEPTDEATLLAQIDGFTFPATIAWDRHPDNTPAEVPAAWSLTVTGPAVRVERFSNTGDEFSCPSVHELRIPVRLDLTLGSEGNIATTTLDTHIDAFGPDLAQVTVAEASAPVEFTELWNAPLVGTDLEGAAWSLHVVRSHPSDPALYMAGELATFPQGTAFPWLIEGSWPDTCDWMHDCGPEE